MRLLNMERRLLTATLAGFAPEDGPGLAPTRGEVDWTASFEQMAGASNAQARLGMRAAIWLAGLSPMWMHGRVATLASLPQTERAAVLEELLAHRSFAVRELTLLLKLQSAFALLGTASARARSGYDRDRPPPLDTPDEPPARTHLPVLDGVGGER